METTSTLLTWMTFLPLIGMGLIGLLLAGRKLAGLGAAIVDNGSRVIALVAGAVNLGLGLYLWGAFDGSADTMQFVHRFVWIRQFNIEYFVGVDGLSVAMVILTVLISFVATVASMPWWGFKRAEGDSHGKHFSTTRCPAT